MSALLGHPPNSDHDLWIQRAIAHRLVVLNPKLAGKLKPENGAAIFLKLAQPGNNASRASTAFASAIAAIVMIVSAVSLRLAIRLAVKRLKCGVDDLMLVIGAAILIARNAIVIMMTLDAGFGDHIWNVTYAEFATFLNDGSILNILLYTGFAMVKLSILFFVRRLLQNTHKRWRMVTDVLLVMVTIYVIVFFFLYLCLCRPIRASFDLAWIGQYGVVTKCFSFNKLYVAANVLHIILDFMLLPIPVIVIWQLSLEKAQKIQLTAVFAIGCVTCALGIARIVVNEKKTPDLTWSMITEVTLSVWEGVVIVLVACLPVIVPTLAGHTHSIWGYSRRHPHSPHSVQSPKKHKSTEASLGSSESGTGIRTFHSHDTREEPTNHNRDSEITEI